MISRLLASIILIVACFAGQTAYASSLTDLIIGEWKQVGELVDDKNGSALRVRETEVEYFPDGKLEGDALLFISYSTDTSWAFKVEFKGTYSIDTISLNEVYDEVSVVSLDKSAASATTAKELESELLANSGSESIFIQLNEHLAEVMDTKTGVRTVFVRD